MNPPMETLYHSPALQRTTGPVLRPGGLLLTETAVGLCGFMPDDRILDTGCGYGMTARYLSQAHRLRVSAMDISFDMLKEANRKKEQEDLVQTGPAPGYIRSRLPAVPFAKGIFDGIFCECVLSLVPQKATCLTAFFRVLKNRGRLVLTDLFVPEAAAPASGRPTSSPLSCMDGALTLSELTELIESAGFKIRVVENHTRLLKQMAGQIILDHGSLEKFWEMLPGNLKNSCRSRQIRSGTLKPEYAMIIAEKYE